ncbi:MAG: hypothetical protein KDD69_08580, partial [Bdellovibrionales bacterium]|nr:hypothetical protein [Bdellovibrionales bacterium]
MSDQPTPSTNQSNPVLPPVWLAYLSPFADAIRMPVPEVSTALATLAGEPGEAAIGVLADEEFSPFEEIKQVLSSVPTGVLKKAVSEHLRKKPSTAEPNAATVLSQPSFDALPQAPDDDAWLQMLKTGGTLKVDTATVISAIRAALAGRSGLYDLPSEIVTRMERHAEALEEPVGEDFFKLRKLLTTRSYAEIFAALDVDGQFVSQKKKSAFLQRLDEILWPELLSFHRQLQAWADSWQQGMANPAAMMGAFFAMSQGGRVGSALPPGMLQPPATDGLRDVADAFKDQVNRVFAGVGIPVARALAYDALKIKEVLQNPNLPAQVGAVNRDQMLKMFGANVSADYVRLERNITRYTLAVLEYTDTTSGQEELGYLSALLMLGLQIPFDKLSTLGRGVAMRPEAAQARRSRSHDSE